MGLVTFAKDEFKRLNIDVDSNDDNDYDVWGAKCVLKLIEEFANQGHSGLSASWVLEVFDKLARYKPLSPLTTNEEEWFLISEEDNLYQNKRCPTVFAKSKNGEGAHYLDGRVFIDKNGYSFTNKHSCVNITFPCRVEDIKTEYIHEDSAEHMDFMYNTGIDPFEDHYTCDGCYTSDTNEDEVEVSVICSEEVCTDGMYDAETDQVLDSEGYLPNSDEFIKSSLVEYTKDNVNKEVNDQLYKVDNELYRV